jgi:hypothetical protein
MTSPSRRTGDLPQPPGRPFDPSAPESRHRSRRCADRTMAPDRVPARIYQSVWQILWQIRVWGTRTARGDRMDAGSRPIYRSLISTWSGTRTSRSPAGFSRSHAHAAPGLSSRAPDRAGLLRDRSVPAGDPAATRHGARAARHAPAPAPREWKGVHRPPRRLGERPPRGRGRNRTPTDAGRRPIDAHMAAETGLDRLLRSYVRRPSPFAGRPSQRFATTSIRASFRPGISRRLMRCPDGRFRDGSPGGPAVCARLMRILWWVCQVVVRVDDGRVRRQPDVEAQTA